MLPNKALKLIVLRRRLHFLGRYVAGVLGERPPVPLQVLHDVGAVTPEHVLELRMNLRSGGPRSGVVGVHAIDIHGEPV